MPFPGTRSVADTAVRVTPGITDASASLLVQGAYQAHRGLSVTRGSRARKGRCDMGVIRYLKASWRTRRDPETRRARKIKKAQQQANIAAERARANAAGAAES